jgi:hypothetical protein
MHSTRPPVRLTAANPHRPPKKGFTLSESTLRIAPRSAVAVADLHLLRVARTEPRQADGRQASLVDRIRGRFGPAASRRS